jgi:hypothetical protein
VKCRCPCDPCYHCRGATPEPSDLRAAAEALNDGNTYLYRHPAMPTGKYTELVDRAAVLAILDAHRCSIVDITGIDAIEKAVRDAHRCYDEAALAAALHGLWRELWVESAMVGWHYRGWYDEDVFPKFDDGTLAAAIIERLR